MSWFELPVQLEAGCVEHDLQITKDGVLVSSRSDVGALNRPSVERLNYWRGSYPLRC